LSIEEEAGVIVTVSAAFTVTVTAFEVVVTAPAPELSITCSSNDQVPVVASTPVELVGRSPTLQLNELPRSV
jgi:P pilus assembly chaperone PapD